jgi:hypothetical protein
MVEKIWTDEMRARFAGGTFARISAVLRPDEDRTEFVRTAVEWELNRRLLDKEYNGWSDG